MHDIAIRIAGLGKKFPRGLYSNLIGDRFRQAVKAEWFWALQDIDLEIRRGETFGLVGRNGAGKTTLLRILARITKPTVGRAEIHGNLGALLEVGTGFHGELSGRENVFLNGALMGLRDSEIRARFDAIVGFSELEDAIDTPIKWYSSGMKARLGFSVAVHLEAEILLIDETLAVGDEAFREKATRRIQELIRSDRTVVLTGHQHSLITQLCDRAMWLDHGKPRAVGSAAAVVQKYLAAYSSNPVDPRQLPLFPVSGGSTTPLR